MAVASALQMKRIVVGPDGGRPLAPPPPPPPPTQPNSNHIALATQQTTRDDLSKSLRVSLSHLTFNCNQQLQQQRQLISSLHHQDHNQVLKSVPRLSSSCVVTRDQEKEQQNQSSSCISYLSSSTTSGSTNSSAHIAASNRSRLSRNRLSYAADDGQAPDNRNRQRHLITATQLRPRAEVDASASRTIGGAQQPSGAATRVRNHYHHHHRLSLSSSDGAGGSSCSLHNTKPIWKSSGIFSHPHQVSSRFLDGTPTTTTTAIRQATCHLNNETTNNIFTRRRSPGGGGGARIAPKSGATDGHGGVSASTSISRLRQGALLARRHSRQFIASTGAIDSQFNHSNNCHQIDQIGKPTTRQQVSHTGGRVKLSPRLELAATSRFQPNLNLSTSNRVRHLARATSASVSCLAPAPATCDGETISSRLRRDQLAPTSASRHLPATLALIRSQQARAIGSRCRNSISTAATTTTTSSSSGSRRLASGKTPAKFSLASSTSSLSLAAVKRPRAATTTSSSSSDSASESGTFAVNHTPRGGGGGGKLAAHCDTDRANLQEADARNCSDTATHNLVRQQQAHQINGGRDRDAAQTMGPAASTSSSSSIAASTSQQTEKKKKLVSNNNNNNNQPTTTIVAGDKQQQQQHVQLFDYCAKLKTMKAKAPNVQVETKTTTIEIIDENKRVGGGGGDKNGNVFAGDYNEAVADILAASCDSGANHQFQHQHQHQQQYLVDCQHQQSQNKLTIEPEADKNSLLALESGRENIEQSSISGIKQQLVVAAAAPIEIDIQFNDDDDDDNNSAKHQQQDQLNNARQLQYHQTAIGLLQNGPATMPANKPVDSAPKSQPFGLHQSINIDLNNVDTSLMINSSQNGAVVGHCLNDLVDEIKSSTTVPVAMFKDCYDKKLFSIDQAPLVETTTKNLDFQHQQKTIDIPVKSDELINDFYDLEPRPFARGKFAQVKRCINRRTKKCFAAKCIKKRRRLVDIRHEIFLEIEALKLSYYTKHIVKLYEVYETPNEIILVLEMANGGELQRVLDDEEFIEEKLVQKMVQQILEGLIYLHDSEIAHLDIKPQNLLLTEPFPHGDIKLCDFGISRRISKDCEIREICGTPDYVAPEILRYDPISLATDMWSLGVLTYVLLSGYSPFGSENKQQTFCNITQAALDFPSEIFDKISPDGIDFIKKLIVREPSDRLTSRQARGHHWLNTMTTTSTTMINR